MAADRLDAPASASGWKTGLVRPKGFQSAPVLCVAPAAAQHQPEEPSTQGVTSPHSRSTCCIRDAPILLPILMPNCVSVISVLALFIPSRVVLSVAISGLLLGGAVAAAMQAILALESKLTEWDQVRTISAASAVLQAIPLVLQAV